MSQSNLTNKTTYKIHYTKTKKNACIFLSLSYNLFKVYEKKYKKNHKPT